VLTLVVRALVSLLIYDLLIKVSSFQALYARVKAWKIRPGDGQDDIERIVRAINYACALYPKHALCLQRAFATTYLLRKRGIAAQMVLGAQQLPFRAHAWVEVDGKAINERSNVQANYLVWERC
jgi:hypothetical protein